LAHGRKVGKWDTCRFYGNLPKTQIDVNRPNEF
jgi:hypothetical protein